MQILTLTVRTAADPTAPVLGELPLTADQRARSRYRYDLGADLAVLLRLPRGTILAHGDLLEAPTGERVRVVAQPEPTLWVTASSAIALVTAAYHLGNRHVPLEIQPDGLRLAPDPVLAAMVRGLGLTVREEVAPFQPVGGAYGDRAVPQGATSAHDHSHSHDHGHSHSHPHP
ncbi:MAG: hypothetical protein Fur0042_18160 [Cyanophyceae cyanobacterium]